MSEQKIQANQLNAGDVIAVRGKTAFSRITSQYQGEELQRRIQQQRQTGMQYVTDKPHTTMSLNDAAVQFADPNNPTVSEMYVHQRIFTRSKGEHAGRTAFNIDDKSFTLPAILQYNQDTGAYEQIIPEGELDRELDVTLILTVFQAKNQTNRGLDLTYVVLNEPIRYFSTNQVDPEHLKALGITIGGAVTPQSAEEANAAFQAEQTPANTVIEGGYAMPGPAAAPAPQAAPQQPVQQPVQQTQPQPAAPQFAPQQAQAPQQFAPQQAQAPAVQQPQAQPVQPQAQPVQQQATPPQLPEQAAPVQPFATPQQQGTPAGQSAFDAPNQQQNPWNAAGNTGDAVNPWNAPGDQPQQ